MSSRKVTIQNDLTVIGGGLSGICAAIAAARSGIKVSLINDRPVLGGNSSSEIRVWISSAQTGEAVKSSCNYFARETGIIEEILIENRYKNPEGNPHIWDTILLDFIKKEKNIELFLNTYINKVEKKNNIIKNVKGFQLRTNKNYKFTSKLFLDSTGDGVIAYNSGAEYLLGREGKDKFNESLAPEEADNFTMGNTIFFYTKDVGKPVKFKPPEFAYSPEELPFLEDEFHGVYIDERASGCDYWWFEYGGLKDIILEDSEITDELQKIVWGIWDHIKNSGKYDADNLTLEWIGSLPGKRESRRFIGKYILNQNDIQKQCRFPDAVGHGGWPLDIHPPAGIYADTSPCSQIPVGIYDIPFRTLYSKDIKNLFLAGRDHSASRIAFSSTRIMGTCSVMGQAVGIAASLAIKYECNPDQIYNNHIEELQQLLLKDDVYIISKRNEDLSDKARKSKITASSQRDCKNRRITKLEYIDQDMCLVLPYQGNIDDVSLFLGSKINSNLTIEFYTCQKPENYFMKKYLGSYNLSIKKETSKWYNIPLPKNISDSGKKIFILLKKNENIVTGTSPVNLTGVMSFKVKNYNNKYPNLKLLDNTISFAIEEKLNYYSPENIIDGFNRPWGLPHVWASKPLGTESEYLKLDFKQQQEINEIRIYFNSDLKQRFINLKPVKERIIPQIVKDYDIKYLENGEFKNLINIQENYQRFRIHIFKAVKTSALKFLFHNTNGSSNIEVFQIRVY